MRQRDVAYTLFQLGRLVKISAFRSSHLRNADILNRMMGVALCSASKPSTSSYDRRV